MGFRGYVKATSWNWSNLSIPTDDNGYSYFFHLLPVVTLFVFSLCNNVLSEIAPPPPKKRAENRRGGDGHIELKIKKKS